MHRTYSLSLALALLLPACLDRGDSDSQDVSSDLEKANGGMDTADEAPAFGADAEIADAAIEADTGATDALASDPTMTSMDHPGTGFRVVLLWGKLPADRGADQARDWSGSLQVSRGGLLVRHTIGFEDATDSLTPRASNAPGTVAFHSVTRPYVDGLALTVLDPDPATSSSQTLTYSAATGGITYTLDLAQLAHGPIVIDAGDGFKMIAVGHRRRADACDAGFMRGRWRSLSSHLGTYLGVVTNEDGERTGHVRGVFGQRRNGDAVVFGKFIDHEGHFRGLMVGSYANGQYQTRWLDRQGDHGTARGVYFEGAAASTGHFLGRWAETSCSDD